MYSQVNIIKNIEPIAEKFILDNDRMLYLSFFERVEKFCADNSVLIGGRAGLDLLVGKPVTKDSFVWDLYCDDTFNTAKALADDLASIDSPHVPARTVALMTNLRHKEFTLSINARILFKIYSMDRYRNIKLVELMGPAIRTSYFTKTPIKLISEEMQLIEIYRTLYSPKKLSLWPTELEAEAIIYDMIKHSLGEKAIREINGGAEKFNKPGAEDIILRKVIANGPNVLIGDYAMKGHGLIDTAYRLQFITSNSIDDIQTAIEKSLRNDVRKVKISDVKVTFIRYQLNIPSDFQITKHTIYVNTGREQIPIADVFNSSQFEMIPYWNGGGDFAKIKLANPWVILRFLLIDVWTLKLILNIGTDNPDFIKKRIQQLINNCDVVRTLALTCVSETPEKIFQLTNYVGNFIDENVAKKKMIKELGERFPVYYPAKQISGAGDKYTEETNETDFTPVHLQPQFTSVRIDFTIDVPSKIQILKKIVGKVQSNATIMDTLKAYHGTAREYSQWGVNKNANGFFNKNASLVKFIPASIDTYLDIGCGDGLDIAAVKTRYVVANAICADINDNRDSKYKDSKYLHLEIGVPMEISDSSVDFATIFHVIHHAIDAESRLNDISRVMKSGGILLLKDHDVRTSIDASNVDFEHLVYDVGTTNKKLSELIEKYHEIEPMYYFNSDQVIKYMESIGFSTLFIEVGSGPTRVYRAAFIKK